MTQHNTDTAPLRPPTGSDVHLQASDGAFDSAQRANGHSADSQHPQPIPGKILTPRLWGFLNTHDRGTDLRVWCAWCCHWHTHGGQGVQTGNIEHRLAHCYTKDSPYKSSGYWIDVSGTPWAAAKGNVREATPAQQQAMWSGRISPAVKALRQQPAPQPDTCPPSQHQVSELDYRQDATTP